MSAPAVRIRAFPSIDNAFMRASVGWWVAGWLATWLWLDSTLDPTNDCLRRLLLFAYVFFPSYLPHSRTLLPFTLILSPSLPPLLPLIYSAHTYAHTHTRKWPPIMPRVELRSNDPLITKKLASSMETLKTQLAIALSMHPSACCWIVACPRWSCSNGWSFETWLHTRWRTSSSSVEVELPWDRESVLSRINLRSLPSRAIT